MRKHMWDTSEGSKYIYGDEWACPVHTGVFLFLFFSGRRSFSFFLDYSVQKTGHPDEGIEAASTLQTGNAAVAAAMYIAATNGPTAQKPLIPIPI